MSALRIPLFDEIEEQIAVVVDHARAAELTRWIDWTESKRDKANADAHGAAGGRGALSAIAEAAKSRASAFEAVAHELRAARDKIHDALTAQA